MHLRFKMLMNGMSWVVVACLFADDIVLFEEGEEELQRVVDVFHSVCTKINVNARKSKVMAFERRERRKVRGTFRRRKNGGNQRV